MARGLTRDQIGVTEEMILTYGERIWELSHNIQIRRGDPVRELDWDQIEAQRHGRGMADVEIAEEIGLTREQVLYIRVALERRRFRRENYHRLYELGGGRRFRLERFVPYEHRFGFRSEANELRKALAFDPRITGSYLRLGYWNADTVASWLDRWANERSDHPAVTDATGSVSYAQLRAQSLRLANGMLSMGIRRGDVVALQLRNVREFLLTYLATCLAGGVVCPLPLGVRAQDLEAALNGTHARMVVCHEATGDYDAPTTMLNIGLKTRTLEHIVVLSDNPPDGTMSFDELIADAGNAAIEVAAVASDPAVLILAESDSAPPKLVLHNYHTLLSNSRVVAPFYGLGPNDGVLSAIPFSDAIGLSAINLVLHAGATLHLADDAMTENWTASIREREPTVLFVTSSQLSEVSAAGSLDDLAADSLQKVSVVGASTTDQTLKNLDTALANGKVTRAWGAPECLMVLHSSFDAPEATRLLTLGTATGSFAARMTTPSGDPVAPGSAGELQVRGCSLFAGYVDDRDANRVVFSPDGWFNTGQLAVTDEDGNVRFGGETAAEPQPVSESSATGA